MGLLDAIRGLFNPGIIAIYNELVNNHSEAFRRWKGKQKVGTLSNLFDFRPTFRDKEYIAIHKADILAYEKIIAEENARIMYDKLRKKYPKGLPALERYYSDNNTKNSVGLSLLELVEREEEIAKFERFADEYSSFATWQNDQREFASISRNLKPESFGCYIYDIPLKGVKPDGTETFGEYRVWQHFYTSFCEYPSDAKISDDFAYLSEDADKNPDFLTGEYNYKSSVYDTISDLIIAHKEKVGDISIFFASNGLEPSESIAFNHSKLRYLISKIEEANIPYYKGEGELIQDVELTKYILILEFLSSNARLKETVEFIRNKYASIQPLISYISLRKGFDYEEVLDLELKKGKERQALKEKEKAEKERIQKENERLRLEAERKRQDEEHKVQDLNKLKSCVSSWESLYCGLKYSYLLRYYPTTCNFVATDEEWQDRWTVWNFKNTPGKTSSEAHQDTLSTVVPRLKNKLFDTFGSDVRKLTLVCIPASSQEKTSARYKEFSRLLCSETGMENSYDKISVIRPRDPKHSGGRSMQDNDLWFHPTFFKGKFVILFDDVITRGDSMCKIKKRMQEKGALVVAGLSIGKTKHERPISSSSSSLQLDDLPF